jgi:hypothetical protein
MLKENLEKDAEKLEILGESDTGAPENPIERGEVRSLRLLVDKSIMPQRTSKKKPSS